MTIEFAFVSGFVGGAILIIKFEEIGFFGKC